MAEAAAPSTSPLDDSLAKFLGGAGASTLSPDQVTYGNDLGYDPGTQFRPQGDVLTINAAPGTGASTAETWAHELDVERQKQEALEFEFQQREAAEENARQQAELEMSKASAAQQAALAPSQLASSQYGAQAASYSPEAARLANQQSAYAVNEAARKEADYYNTLNAMNYSSGMNAWMGGAKPTTTSASDYQRYASSPYSQPGYQSQSVNAFYGVPAGTNPYTGTAIPGYVAPAKGTIIGNPYSSNSVRF